MRYQLVDANLRQALRYFALSRARGEICDLAGLQLVSSGVNCSVFNTAMLTTALAGKERELDRYIAEAAIYFAARGLGWSFWLCEDMLDPRTRREAVRIFADRRMRLMTESPGMFAECLAPPVRKAPNLTFRPIADSAERLAFCRITSTAFGPSLEVSKAIYDSEEIWSGGFAGYVAYWNGEAVSTAATVTAPGLVGVYSVATLPGRRRRGCGEATMRHAVQCAGGGRVPVVLEATPLGLSLYRRMGFETVTRFLIFVSD